MDHAEITVQYRSMIFNCQFPIANWQSTLWLSARSFPGTPRDLPRRVVSDIE